MKKSSIFSIFVTYQHTICFRLLERKTYRHIKRLIIRPLMITIHIRNMIDNNQTLNQTGYCNWSRGTELRHLLDLLGSNVNLKEMN